MKKIVSICLAIVLSVCCISTTNVFAASQYGTDYRQWSQGASEYPRVKAYGCFIVAMAKMIVESGVDVSSSFNPDVFAKWEEDNGHITSLSSSVGQNNKLGPQKYAEQKRKKLTYLGPVEYSDNTLWNYINNGHYCIVHIGYSGGSHHYVFVSNVDSKNNGELTFYESGKSSISIGAMSKSKLLSRYKNSSITTIYVYEGDMNNVCSHSYTDPSTELCNKCGEKYQRVENSENKKYTVNVKSINLRTLPYSKAGNSNGVSYAGETVTSSANVTNMYGNKWVKITNSKGQTGYTSINNLKEYNEPQASSLNINLTKYPSSLKQGSGFGLRGTISSNYNVKQIKGYIMNGGNTVQSTIDNVNAKSVDVSGIRLNNNLIFNNLGTGNYTLVVEATDSSGRTVSVKKYFDVYANQTKAASSLSINLIQYPVTLKQGTGFGLRGSVDSNYTIAKVRGYVKNSNGSVVLSSMDTPNSTSMNIQYADLNNSLVFNKLSAGNYTMVVEATDTSGRVVTATKNFVVQGNSIQYTPNTSNNGTGVAGTVSIPSSWTDLSIRTGPSTNYQIVGGMPQGARCTVYPDKASNGWYYVEYNGVWGYASGKQIILGAGATQAVNTRTGIVNIPSSWTDLSIRTGPSTNYQIVGGMPQGARCTVYPDKASNGWYYVDYNGVQGYAAGNRINLQ